MPTIQQMLQDLIEKGWSQSSLARALETNQPSIHRLVVIGKEPGYALGKRIESLYQRENRKSAA